MKKIKLLLFLLLPYLGFSQIKKGDVFLDCNIQGTVFLGQYSNINTNYYSLPVFKLGIGTFINNNNAVGLQILGSYNNAQNITPDYSIGLGLMHWYIYPFGDKWGASLKSEINYKKERLNYFHSSAFIKSTMHEISGITSFGLYYLPFKKIAINASFVLLDLNYSKQYNVKEINYKDKYDINAFKMSGLIPGALSMSNIQMSLIYFLRKN
ncbi:MAG: hypothetical protein Q8M15_11930 [Bacteroidota bacterium]|nr:hypothetical protein [Bacteroidota bacterium]